MNNCIATTCVMGVLSFIGYIGMYGAKGYGL